MKQILIKANVTCLTNALWAPNAFVARIWAKGHGCGGRSSIPICAKRGQNVSLGRRSPTHPNKNARFCEAACAGNS